MKVTPSVNDVSQVQICGQPAAQEKKIPNLGALKVTQKWLRAVDPKVTLKRLRTD